MFQNSTAPVHNRGRRDCIPARRIQLLTFGSVPLRSGRLRGLLVGTRLRGLRRGRSVEASNRRDLKVASGLRRELLECAVLRLGQSKTFDDQPSLEAPAISVETGGQFGRYRGALLTGPVATLATDLADAVLADDFSTAEGAGGQGPRGLGASGRATAPRLDFVRAREVDAGVDYARGVRAPFDAPAREPHGGSRIASV